MADTGRVIASAEAPVKTYLLPSGGAEQDPHEWWQGARRTAREVIAESGVAPNDIVAVACDSQWSVAVPVDVYHINDFMKLRGWRFNVLQLPPALHFCVTMPQTFTPGIAAEFLKDLREGVTYAHAKARTTAETTALYGMAGTVAGNRQMTEIMYGFFDYLYSV